MTALVGCAGYGEQTYDTEHFSITAGGKWDKVEIEGAVLALYYSEFYGEDECYNDIHYCINFVTTTEQYSTVTDEMNKVLNTFKTK